MYNTDMMAMSSEPEETQVVSSEATVNAEKDASVEAAVAVRNAAIAATWKKVKALQKKYNVSDAEFLAAAPVPKVKKEKMVKVKTPKPPKPPKEPKVKKEKVVKVKEPKLNADGTPKKAHTLKGTHIEPKYAYEGKTWSGRGLLPSYLKEAMAKDPTLTKESFLIKK